MKNSLVSILLFVILVSFLFYADHNFKNLCSQIVDKCDLMEYEITPENKKENFDEALKLSVYLEADNLEEAEASLHLLKFSAEHLRDLQNPTLNNIFWKINQLLLITFI